MERDTMTECTNNQERDLETILAAELFSQLSEPAQIAIIDLIKSLLFRE